MNPELIKKTQEFLFADIAEMNEARIPAPMQERIMRLRAMYTYWVSRPSLADKAIVDELVRRYQVSVRTAYDDVRLIKICLGNLNQMTQDYYRWLFLQRCEEGFQMARAENDPNAFARVLASLGKYTRLDKEDDQTPDYSQIVPQQFEISADPEVAGFHRIPDLDKRIDKMLAKFRMEAEDIVPEPEPLKKNNSNDQIHHQG